MDQIIQSKIQKSRLKVLDEGKSRKKPKLQPLTSHTGRKFVNLTPSQGQIILPIRGEKVLDSDNYAEKSYKERSEKLQALLDQTERNAQKKQRTNVKLLPSMVKKPNIVSGIVKNRRGEHLDNAVLIIRNEKGEPVRALKTNQLGKFFISSPLPNGNYQIEIDKKGYSFDIIPFRVDGSLLPSFEIIGR